MNATGISWGCPARDHLPPFSCSQLLWRPTQTPARRKQPRSNTAPSQVISYSDKMCKTMWIQGTLLNWFYCLPTLVPWRSSLREWKRRISQQSRPDSKIKLQVAQISHTAQEDWPEEELHWVSVSFTTALATFSNWSLVQASSRPSLSAQIPLQPTWSHQCQ